MKLTAKVKLKPSPKQADALKRTIEVVNECCNWVSGQAWEARIFTHFALHKHCYSEARLRFPLSSQMVVRAIAKVAEAYKLDKLSPRLFRKHGAVTYDSRVIRFMLGAAVSIWSVNGRLKMEYATGGRQRELLKSQQGETDLIYHRGQFYLAAVCNIEDPSPADVDDFLGVDFGVVNIASDSDGNRYSGSAVKSVRYRHRRLRTKLQRKRTRSAKRRLKALAGKEHRFATNVNHVISKQIVATAKGTGRGIAIENLKGIRNGRLTVRRRQRDTLHSWAFFQLCWLLQYKAKLAGIPVVTVDPRNSSRACSVCGHTDKANRPTQERFSCRSCGFTAHADFNAAVNLRERGRAHCQRAERSELCSSVHNSVTSRLL